MVETLKDRVLQFQMMELPGQPQMMHMGTSYLVHDLWQEVKRLEAERAEMLEALRDAYPVLDMMAVTDSDPRYKKNADGVKAILARATADQ